MSVILAIELFAILCVTCKIGAQLGEIAATKIEIEATKQAFGE